MSRPCLTGLHASILCLPACCLQMQDQRNGIWVTDTLRPQRVTLK